MLVGRVSARFGGPGRGRKVAQRRIEAQPGRTRRSEGAVGVGEGVASCGDESRRGASEQLGCAEAFDQA